MCRFAFRINHVRVYVVLYTLLAQRAMVVQVNAKPAKCTCSLTLLNRGMSSTNRQRLRLQRCMVDGRGEKDLCMIRIADFGI